MSFWTGTWQPSAALREKALFINDQLKIKFMNLCGC